MGAGTLTPRTEAWRQQGSIEHMAGWRIFVREQAGAGPPLLFLHGYPSSSYDWRLVIERLPDQRITAFDFLGFGLSEKPRDVRYSLLLQADIAEAIARRFKGEPVVLVAHDMGSSVATELLARAVEERLSFPLRAVVLTNASLVRERASLLWGQKLLLSRLGPLASRLTNQLTFRRQFAGIFSAQHPLSSEEAADQWSLLAHDGGHRLLQRLIYYNHERVTPPWAQRWHGALSDWVGELSIGWAGQDPICTEAVLQAVLALRPDMPLSRWPELGHYPQIEDPDAVTRHIREAAAAPPQA